MWNWHSWNSIRCKPPQIYFVTASCDACGWQRTDPSKCKEVRWSSIHDLTFWTVTHSQTILEKELPQNHISLPPFRYSLGLLNSLSYYTLGFFPRICYGCPGAIPSLKVEEHALFISMPESPRCCFSMSIRFPPKQSLPTAPAKDAQLSPFFSPLPLPCLYSLLLPNPLLPSHILLTRLRLRPHFPSFLYMGYSQHPCFHLPPSWSQELSTISLPHKTASVCLPSVGLLWKWSSCCNLLTLLHPWRNSPLDAIPVTSSSSSRSRSSNGGICSTRWRLREKYLLGPSKLKVF